MASAPPGDRFSSLPAPLTPLVGREREVEALVDLLRREGLRLVTPTESDRSPAVGPPA